VMMVGCSVKVGCAKQPDRVLVIEVAESVPDGVLVIEGLRWYSQRLKVDEDGDVAHEFIEEVFLETTSNTAVHCKQFPIFEVKLNTKNAKARSPVLSSEGKIQQYVEFQGQLLLV
ncbi:hypothetical protein Tco_0528940, partial [Tanacetum coccineum]